MRRSVAGMLLAGWAFSACAADLTATLDLSPEWRADNRGSAYFVGPPLLPADAKALRQDLGLRVQQGGFNAQGTLRLQAREGQALARHGIVEQFYYDGEIDAGHGYTVGKKVMSWGVGFGFRPLDVVQREDRRAPNPPPLVGVPVLAWERLSADQALTLVWTHPGSGRGATAVGDAALAAHWYKLAGGTDLHAVARVSARNALEAGAGASFTVGEAWSFHGAALNQRRYTQKLNALAENGGVGLAAASPLVDAPRRNALKLVAGGQWTGESGVGALLEAWHDGEAYSRDEWRRLDRLTLAQRALSGAPQAAIDANVAWSSQAFARPNLLRDNLLARLSYDEEQRWQYALEWLATPADGGRAITLSMAWQGNVQKFVAGVRFLGGAADSALAQAPFKRLLWLGWRLAL